MLITCALLSLLCGLLNLLFHFSTWSDAQITYFIQTESNNSQSLPLNPSIRCRFIPDSGRRLYLYSFVSLLSVLYSVSHAIHLNLLLMPLGWGDGFFFFFPKIRFQRDVWGTYTRDGLCTSFSLFFKFPFAFGLHLSFSFTFSALKICLDHGPRIYSSHVVHLWAFCFYFPELIEIVFVVWNSVVFSLCRVGSI